MSTALLNDLFRFVLAEPEDDLMQQQQKKIARVLVGMVPEVEAEAVSDARVDEKRTALRSVLARRGLPLTAAEQARIAACTDLATLARWLDQAVDAPSAADALR